MEKIWKLRTSKMYSRAQVVATKPSQTRMAMKIAALRGLRSCELGEDAEDGGGDEGTEERHAILDRGNCNGKDRVLDPANAGEPGNHEDRDPDKFEEDRGKSGHEDCQPVELDT